MKKHLVYIFSFLIAFLKLNALSNNDSRLKDLLTEFKFSLFYLYEPSHIFQGLHPINEYGWYVTTKQIANKTDLIEYKNYRDVFIQDHDLFNLALVYFKPSISYIPREGSSRLKLLATSEDLKRYPWVLSLAKLTRDEAILLKSISYPLGAVSQINYQGSLLALEKGRMEDFYRQSGTLCTKLFREQVNKYLDKLNKHSRNSYRSTFIQKWTRNQNKNGFKAINYLCNELEKLKLQKATKNLYDLYLSDEYKIIVDTFLKTSDSLEQEVDKSSEIKEKEKILLKFLNSKLCSKKNQISQEEEKLKSLANEPEDSNKIDEHWKHYQTALIKEMKESEELKKFLELREDDIHFNQEKIDEFWNFESQACMGVADSNDIGGGIYSYPRFQNLAFDFSSNHLDARVSCSLAGITVHEGICGEMSLAINLTRPEIREWMLGVMDNYYKNRIEITDY